MEEKKEHKTAEHNISNVESSEPSINTSTSSKKSNPWIYATVILGIVLVVLLYFVYNGGLPTGKVVAIPGDQAGQKLTDFLNTKVPTTSGGVKYVSNKDVGNLYEVTVSYQGQDIPVYITKDGLYFVQGAVLLSDLAGQAGNASATPTPTPTPQEVPKSDKPIVEAFIFSYCPYGLQFEKALAPVYDLLKTRANISIVAIGAMHGEFEKVESLRQICIEKNYGKDILWSYLKDFDASTDISACNGQDACVNPLVEKIFTKYKIDKNKINTCMQKDAQAIYDSEGARAQELGISGSPTFVINGVQVQVGRTPDAIKQAVCNAYNKAPAECNKTLSTASASAGFGSSASSSGTGAGSQCS